ncbi:acyl-CoA dehydrogenase [Vannielia litorea]|uniref:acyl-CoA dehydrogenase n=1 Tax=Vannielia litorea TaxID=1217970 RepID=UPI001BCD0153|nr:acyl-CoA dehydrogenase [Vannielia litorea]MBS8226800.1 acyl-CoA dehydrogenase [Vannielia litorea]
MPYTAPVDEFRFLLNHVVGYGRVTETERFAEAGGEMVDAILTEAGRLCTEVLAPLQRNGDLHPAVLENGVVRTSPGFAEGYKAIAEGGWIGISADPEHGGMGLPIALMEAVNEMMNGACLSLALNPLLTQGQIEALEHHASDELKALYLPKLISGEWQGTMNLTEPQAGTDVGALRSKAEPNGDGSYSISGQKIYISWGDADFAENVCHLVLARLPDGVPGTKGISLFMVPRNIPKADGTPGERNSLRVVSLEHKMGLHGSPTAVMEYDGAKGWLVGREHGGMAAMFTMMNNARLGVGIQGIGVAEAATQAAVAYAADRKQGKVGGAGTIIEFPDVRRMLMTMKAETQAARAIALANAVALDIANATGDAGWAARAALFTPISKAYGTDVGCEVAATGIQVHGGMGFIEETGAAQFYRDVRVTTIYEGTNGIQALDLVGRKLADGGEAALTVLSEIQDAAEAARGRFPRMTDAVWNAAEVQRELTEAVLEMGMEARGAVAVAYLRAFARVLGAHYHLASAMAEQKDAGPRTGLARFYITRLLPQHSGLAAEVRMGGEGIDALSNEELAG